MSEGKPAKKIRLANLYYRQGRNGDYYVGSLGGVSVVMFPNSYKQKDDDAEWVLYLMEKTQQQGQAQAQPRQRQAPRRGPVPNAAPQRTRSAPQSRPPQDDVPMPDDDEVPY